MPRKSKDSPFRIRQRSRIDIVTTQILIADIKKKLTKAVRNNGDLVSACMRLKLSLNELATDLENLEQFWIRPVPPLFMDSDGKSSSPTKARNGRKIRSRTKIERSVYTKLRRSAIRRKATHGNPSRPNKPNQR